VDRQAHSQVDDTSSIGGAFLACIAARTVGKAYPALVSLVTDGAWVGVVGVAIGGVITIAGTVVNGRIALRTTETTIESEERQRLWEKRCAAYEETVREVLARQTRRETLTSRGDPGNIGSHPIEEMRKHEEPQSIRISASAARPGLVPLVDYQGVLDAMYKSKEDAVTADKDLFDKINQELSWTPRAAPVRRGFWGSRRS
jgi:hypothetical protein